MRKVFLSLGLIALVGCAGPQKVAGPRPSLRQLFQWRQMNHLFQQVRSTMRPIQTVGSGRRKAYRVGDIVTVVLDESLDADTTTKNTASRKTKTDVLSPLQIAKWGSQADFCRMTSKRKTKYRQLAPA